MYDIGNFCTSYNQQTGKLSYWNGIFFLTTKISFLLPEIKDRLNCPISFSYSNMTNLQSIECEKNNVCCCHFFFFFWLIWQQNNDQVVWNGLISKMAEVLSFSLRMTREIYFYPLTNYPEFLQG